MKSIGAFISWFIVLSAIIGVTIIIGLQMTMAPGPLPEDKTVIIEKGAGVGQIAETLAQEGVIGSPFMFKIASRVIADPKSLKAGEYKFSAQIPMAGVLGKLQLGDTIQHQLTIPEGLTTYEVVEILNNNKELGGEQITAIPPEGTLLPETYSFQLSDSRQDKIERMTQNMTEVLNEEWDAKSENLPFNTKEEALILASIVEKETSKPEERARVAGVFINRLKAGIPLQTDPTIIYAIHKGRPQTQGQGPIGRRLLKKDLQIDSPYNTYLNPGLPPGPIANPGKDAIEATLHPEEHGYLFFVADGTGGHLFAKTLEEHNNNVANWRTIRKQKEEEAAKQKEENNIPVIDATIFD